MLLPCVKHALASVLSRTLGSDFLRTALSAGAGSAQGHASWKWGRDDSSGSSVLV